MGLISFKPIIGGHKKLPHLLYCKKVISDNATKKKGSEQQDVAVQRHATEVIGLFMKNMKQRLLPLIFYMRFFLMYCRLHLNTTNFLSDIVRKTTTKHYLQKFHILGGQELSR